MRSFPFLSLLALTILNFTFFFLNCFIVSFYMLIFSGLFHSIFFLSSLFFLISIYLPIFFYCWFRSFFPFVFNFNSFLLDFFPSNSQAGAMGEMILFSIIKFAFALCFRFCLLYSELECVWLSLSKKETPWYNSFLQKILDSMLYWLTFISKNLIGRFHSIWVSI